MLFLGMPMSQGLESDISNGIAGGLQTGRSLTIL
jgi:hypothetical protein